MAKEEIRGSAERDFQAYIIPLEMINSFKYLGRFLTAADNNWPAVVGNLHTEHKSWSRLARIMGREGASLRVSGMLSRR